METTEQRSRSSNGRSRRATESTEQRARRLAVQRNYQREYRRRQRAQQTEVEHQEQLRSQRAWERQVRAEEDNTRRASRLESNRVRTHESRASETASDREARLDTLRTRDRQSRASETASDREARLNTSRTRARQSRAPETTSDREARLDTLGTCARQSRALETTSGREARLDTWRSRAQQSRALETTVDREDRLVSDRIRSAGRSQTECPVFGNERVKQKVLAFHSKLAEVKFASCDMCLESFPGLSVKQNECSRCSRDKKTPKLYSALNLMDLGPVPPELQGLSQVEEMLISAVMPIMTVYRLPHGQLGYNGHVVNLPQDVGAFVATLPRLVHELDVLVVRREGVSGVHKDFKVRRARVLSALRWLKANNVYYRNITISDSALEQLPQHGDVTTLPSVDIQDSSSDIA